MADAGNIIAGVSAGAATLAAVYAGAQANLARRSAEAAEQQVVVGKDQVVAARAQANAAEREARAAEDSARIAQEQLGLAQEQADRDAERDVENNRPRLEAVNDRPSPGGFNLRITEPLEAWLINRGPGSAVVDEVRLDIGGQILDGSPRARGGAQPVDELVVGEGEECNVYVPSSAALTGLVNDPTRNLRLEVRSGIAGQGEPKWWVSLQLERQLGDTGRRQWIATSVGVRRAG